MMKLIACLLIFANSIGATTLRRRRLSSVNVVGITVDGVASDWDLANDYSIPMYNAGRSDSSWSGYDLAARAYLRADYETKTLCVLVKAEGSNTIQQSLSDAWIKDYGQPGDGKYVSVEGIKFVVENSKTVGWEGCFEVPDANLRNTIEIHANYNNGNTASTGKRASPISLDLGPNGPAQYVLPVDAPVQQEVVLPTEPAEADVPANQYDLEYNFLANLYNAGDTTREPVAKAYKKVLCDQNTVCIYVMAEAGKGYTVSETKDNAWMKDYASPFPNGMYEEVSFTFIRQYDEVVGWEGCFLFPESYRDTARLQVEVHANYDVAGGEQGNTASTGKSPNYIEMDLYCPVAPEVVAESDQPAETVAETNPIVDNTATAQDVQTVEEEIAYEPAAAQPNVVGIIPDGYHYQDWDITTDYSLPMFKAGRDDPTWAGYELAAKAYLRSDCATKTLCVLVLAEGANTIEPSLTNSWLKDYSIGGSGKYENPGGIHFVQGDAGKIVGWEGCFIATDANLRETIEIHANYNAGDTASTGKTASPISLDLSCDGPAQYTPPADGIVIPPPEEPVVPPEITKAANFYDSYDFVYDMHTAGDKTKALVAQAYARILCNEGAICILVEAMPGIVIDETTDNAWLKDYAAGLPNDKYETLTFAFIRQYDEVVGWEGCFKVPSTFELRTQIEIHANYGGGQTASTGKQVDGNLINMDVKCVDGMPVIPPPEPEPEPVPLPEATPAETWERTTELLAPMYNQGNSEKEHVADAYLQLKCDEGAFCILVEAMAGITLADSADDAWIKDYTAGLTGDQYETLSFQFIVTNGDIVGWEGCFKIPAGLEDTLRTRVEIHANYNGLEGTNTASTGKPSNSQLINMDLTCPAEPLPAPFVNPDGTIPLYEGGNNANEIVAYAEYTLDCGEVDKVCLKVMTAPTVVLFADALTSDYWIKDYAAGLDGDKYPLIGDIQIITDADGKAIGWSGCFEIPVFDAVRTQIEINTLVSQATAALPTAVVGSTGAVDVSPLIDMDLTCPAEPITETPYGYTDPPLTPATEPCAIAAAGGDMIATAGATCSKLKAGEVMIGDVCAEVFNGATDYLKVTYTVTNTNYCLNAVQVKATKAAVDTTVVPDVEAFPVKRNDMNPADCVPSTTVYVPLEDQCAMAEFMNLPYFLLAHAEVADGANGGALVSAWTDGTPVANSAAFSEFMLSCECAAEPAPEATPTGDIDGSGNTAAEEPRESGGGFGDPHLKTWIGDTYDFHGQCDMVLVRSPGFAGGVGLEIQIRTEIRRDWSFISEAAIKIGDDVLQVGSRAVYYVNGLLGEQYAKPHELGDIGGFPAKYFAYGKRRHKFEIQLGANQVARIKVYNEFLAVSIDDGDEADFGESVGLMGNFHTGALVQRDGSITKDTREFGFDWQVRDTEKMLFQEAKGPQYPQLCKMPSPKKIKHRKLLESMVAYKEAEEACAFLEEEERESCIFDVLSTGDLSMADAGAM